MSDITENASPETGEDVLGSEDYALSRNITRCAWNLLWLIPLLVCVIMLASNFQSGSAQASQGDVVSESALLAAETAVSSVGSAVTDAEKSIEYQVENAWCLVLINGCNPLPDDFTAPELTQLEDGQSIDSRVFPALQEMMNAAKAAGLQPVICSSFRTWNKQEKLYRVKVNYYLKQGYAQSEAEDMAAFWVARPGTSEHQAGLAVDIVDASYQQLDEMQENTSVQKWLMENCADYGFILRYPTSKNNITGVGYEPWHYRYVGVQAAHEIMDQGLCLEEYLSD